VGPVLVDRLLLARPEGRALLLGLLHGLLPAQLLRVGNLLLVCAIYTDLLPLGRRLTRMSAV
jgi:hypothetical protein